MHTQINTFQLFQNLLRLAYWQDELTETAFLTVSAAKLLLSTFEHTLPIDWVTDSHLPFKSGRICIHTVDSHTNKHKLRQADPLCLERVHWSLNKDLFVKTFS